MLAALRSIKCLLPLPATDKRKTKPTALRMVTSQFFVLSHGAAGTHREVGDCVGSLSGFQEGRAGSKHVLSPAEQLPAVCWLWG